MFGHTNILTTERDKDWFEDNQRKALEMSGFTLDEFFSIVENPKNITGQFQKMDMHHFKKTFLAIKAKREEIQAAY